MTQDVWWYVLAGFLVGFCLSTIWEWLYFRAKRMRIENRRIAELEAALRSSTPVSVLPGFVAPPYESPGVFLETESPERRSALLAAAAVATAAMAANEIDETSFGPQPQTNASGYPAGSAAASPSETAKDAIAAAAVIATTAAAATALDGDASPSAAAQLTDQPAISAEQIDTLVSSIQHLIDTIDSNRTNGTAGDTAVGTNLLAGDSRPEDPVLDHRTGTFEARDLSPSEYAVVRLMQSVRQYFHELATLFRERAAQRQRAAGGLSFDNGAGGGASSDSDEFTMIPGLTVNQAQRLHLAGITTFRQLAGLSRDELEQLFATPQSGPRPDFDRWLSAASTFAIQAK